jgi:hypothetical protein
LRRIFSSHLAAVFAIVRLRGPGGPDEVLESVLGASRGAREVAMARGLEGSKAEGSSPIEGAPEAIDVATILDNVVRLDQMLDESSRRQLAELPYLELSKHLKIKKPS